MMPLFEADLSLMLWCPENFMKLNEGKCHLLTFGTIQSNIKIKIGEDNVIWYRGSVIH